MNVTGDTPAEQTDELGNKYWIHTVTVRYATRKADLDAAPLLWEIVIDDGASREAAK